MDSKFWGKLREYFSIYLPKQRNSSEKTVIACHTAWNLLLRFILKEKGILPTSLSFESFTSDIVTEFLDSMEREKGWKASTRNHRLSCIRAFFKYATYSCPKTCSVYADLCAIPLKKGTDSSHVVSHMTRDSVASIIGCTDMASPKGLRDRFFLTLMYDAAARDGEMLRLRVSDIDSERKTVCLFGKGSKPRLVPVSEDTIRLFERYKACFHRHAEKDSCLFYTVHRGEKTPMSDDNVARFLKVYSEQAREKNANVPKNVHPHMFRHSRAMHLYQGGMPLAILSEFLGHENPETTLIYAYADTESKRRAIEKASANLLPPALGEDVPMWDSKDIIELLVRGY